MQLLIGFAIGAPIGFLGGLRAYRGQLARAKDQISYAVQELDRRKRGATNTDLRFHRIDRRLP